MVLLLVDMLFMYESMVIYVKVFVILGMNFNGRMNYGFDKNEY